MKIYLIIYSPIAEEHDILTAYKDAKRASAECFDLNKKYREENPRHWAKTAYFMEEVEVVD